MKKILLILILLLLLVSCSSRSSNDYVIYSSQTVDGYYVYELEQKGLFCNTYYEDIYYSGKTYNYGFSFHGCNPDMAFFIKRGDDYIYIQTALEQDLITMDSLIPILEQVPRNPETISSSKADYYWLDFYINHKSLYVYAGGECDQANIETFNIDGEEYYYSASGCLKDHILYMQDGMSYVSVSDQLALGNIEGKYLIPLLTKAN